jgi:hypothetical protein
MIEMTRIVLAVALGILCIVWLGGCAQQQKQEETAVATLGGTTPEDAFRKYFDYMNSGSYKEAFGILATPSRQAYDRAAVNLAQMRTKLDSIPDPQDRLYLQQLYAKLGGSTGEDLFIALLKMSEIPQNTTPVTLGSITQMGDNAAEAMNSAGIKVSFIKEPDGLWRIELPQSQLEASLGTLQARFTAMGTATVAPQVTPAPVPAPESKTTPEPKSEVKK